MRVLILGSNPSAKEPRKDSTMHRVKRWACILGIVYDFDNVIEHHVEKETIDDVSFIRVLNLTMKYDRIITLGKFADSILSKMKIQHYAMPHPSPRNRQFNDPTFEERALQKLLSSGFLS